MNLARIIIRFIVNNFDNKVIVEEMAKKYTGKYYVDPVGIGNFVEWTLIDVYDGIENAYPDYSKMLPSAQIEIYTGIHKSRKHHEYIK